MRSDGSKGPPPHLPAIKEVARPEAIVWQLPQSNTGTAFVVAIGDKVHHQKGAPNDGDDFCAEGRVTHALLTLGVAIYMVVVFCPCPKPQTLRMYSNRLVMAATRGT